LPPPGASSLNFVRFQLAQFPGGVAMINLRFKTELLKQGISQVALAHRLGIDGGHLSNIIRGWKKPPDYLKSRIAKILGKDPTWLFPEGEGMPL